MSRSQRFSCSTVWALGIALLLAPTSSAARLLQVYIEQDGKVVAHTYYDDGGHADAATVWRYLADPPIMVDDDATRVVADAGRPLRATLEGDLLVRIQHVDRIIAQARLSTLILQRADEQSAAWFLPQAEVERTAGVAGLRSPAMPSGSIASPVATLVSVALFTLLLVGFLVALAFLLFRRPGPVNQNDS